MDECISEKQCHVYAQCTNTDGSYTCGCLDGYAGDGKNCTGERLDVVRSMCTRVESYLLVFFAFSALKYPLYCMTTSSKL